MNKELLEKQIAEYRNELKVTAENRDKMIQMVNQQEQKIQQLMGAIAAIERILQEEKDGGLKDEPTNPESKTTN